MNPIFAADTAAIFEGPLSVAAVYAPATGDPVSIRVIPSIGDQATRFSAGTFVSAAGSFLIRTAAVATPAEGDVLTIADVGSFTVQGKPVRDDRRLWWRVEAKPS